MPLSQPVNRSPRHTRAITAEAYLREDGLWDIEVRLTDSKPRDIALAGNRIRPVGSRCMTCGCASRSTRN